MFCQKCGSKLDEGSRFCEKCGAKLDAKENVKIDDNDVVLNVKSTFKTLYASIGLILFLVIMLVICLLAIVGTNSINGIEIAMGVMGGVTLFTAIPWIIIMFINKLQYNKYHYDFYKTKIIYRDSFLNITEKEVKYKFVREIVYTQTFVQRFFNIGNIMIYTNAESGFANGILIRSVENVKDVYDKVKKVIDV